MYKIGEKDCYGDKSKQFIMYSRNTINIVISYKIKHIPKRNILKTQNTSQNQHESWISNESWIRTKLN